MAHKVFLHPEEYSLRWSTRTKRLSGCFNLLMSDWWLHHFDRVWCLRMYSSINAFCSPRKLGVMKTVLLIHVTLRFYENTCLSYFFCAVWKTNHISTHTHLHKHTNEHTRKLTPPWPWAARTPNPSPWNLAPTCLMEITGATMLWCQKSYPGADININIVILSLMPSLALCWLSHTVSLSQGRAAASTPRTGLWSSLEISRCSNHLYNQY